MPDKKNKIEKLFFFKQKKDIKKSLIIQNEKLKKLNNLDIFI